MSEASSTRKGFTLVELLTVLAIITLLVGLLVPSLNVVRQTSKEAKQKAMLTAIGSALTVFRNDYGDYPPSQLLYRNPALELDGCGGAQNLAEAMFGQDLMGFHPDTGWLAGSRAYGFPNPSPANLQERKSPYLDSSTVGVFRLGDLYSRVLPHHPGFPLAPGTYVLCDVFGTERVTLADGTVDKAGAPILYYKANQSSRVYDGVVGGSPEEAQSVIYNGWDNQDLMVTHGLLHGQTHPLADLAVFYGDPPGIPFGYIQDPRAPRQWPYRPDSYLLVTAGADGIYGTADDIKNFGN
jgi:prepilin-type N-terminal cleavage/methylation domain-containing protein